MAAVVVDITPVPLKVEEAVVAVVVDQEIITTLLQFLVVVMDGQQHMLEQEDQELTLVVMLLKALDLAVVVVVAPQVEQVVMVDLELLYLNMKFAPEYQNPTQASGGDVYYTSDKTIHVFKATGSLVTPLLLDLKLPNTL